MSRGETHAHRDLKRRAVAWALSQGYRAVATETRLPRSAYRADVAAYKHAAGLDSTAVFECKQARSDFLKDARSQAETLAKLKKLTARRQTLERLLRVHEPSLRRGDSLFAEFDSLDAGRLRHRTYDRVLREIGILQNRLYGKTKFERIRRYQCANLSYLVIVPGLLEEHEIPLGWGVLVAEPGNAAALRLQAKPSWQEVDAAVRLELLHRIAIAGTRALRRDLVVRPDVA